MLPCSARNPLTNSRRGTTSLVLGTKAWTAVVVLLTLAVLATPAPFAAEAQSTGKTPLVGYLTLGAAIPPSVFVSRLRELGYIDKQNVRIEYRFGEGRHDVMGALAGELVYCPVN
jgi:hypothetical protein